MKYLLLALFSLCFCVSFAQQYAIEKLFDTDILEDSLAWGIAGLRSLDSQYIIFQSYDKSLVYQDGYEYDANSFVYDVINQKLIRLPYEKKIFTHLDQDINEINVAPVFAYKKQILYYGIFENNKMYVVAFHLPSQKHTLLDVRNHAAYLEMFEYDGDNYLIAYSDVMNVYKFKNSGLEHQYYLSSFKYNEVRGQRIFNIPKYHNGHIVLLNQGEILSIDVEDWTVDTLVKLNIPYSPEYDYCSQNIVPTQVITRDTQMYITYQLGLYCEGRIEEWFSGFVDSLILIQTDGKKSGTKIIYDSPNVYSLIIPSSTDGQLYFMEYDLANKNNVNWYHVQEDSLEFIHTIHFERDEDDFFMLNQQRNYPTFIHSSISTHNNELVFDNNNSSYLIPDKNVICKIIDGRLEIDTTLQEILYYKSNWINNDWIFISPHNDDTASTALKIFNQDLKIFTHVFPFQYLIDVYNNPYRANEVLLISNENGIYNLSRLYVQDVTNTNDKILLKDSFIHLFPNPSNGLLSMNTDQNMNGNIDVFGIDGKVYYSSRVQGHQMTLDLNYLNSGMYIIKYTVGENFVTKKIILQK